MADPWTQEQQIAFETALLSFTSHMDRDERWMKISVAVGNKTRNQCIARYRYLKEFVASKLKIEAAAKQDM
jgi:Myb-like DNA-binding domain